MFLKTLYNLFTFFGPDTDCVSFSGNVSLHPEVSSSYVSGGILAGVQLSCIILMEITCIF